MQASVYKSTQFESDAIWHLEPVQLSWHNFGDRCTIWDLQNESGGSTEDGLKLLVQVFRYLFTRQD